MTEVKFKIHAAGSLYGFKGEVDFDISRADISNEVGRIVVDTVAVANRGSGIQVATVEIDTKGRSHRIDIKPEELIGSGAHIRTAIGQKIIDAAYALAEGENE